MAIYVGQPFNTTPYNKDAWKWNDACHMLADTVEELHKMASKIGGKRSWFQPLSTPHYNLTKRKRSAAIRNGTKPIGFRQEGELIRYWRKKTSCPDRGERLGL